jgi:hypothetical protein
MSDRPGFQDLFPDVPVVERAEGQSNLSLAATANPGIPTPKPSKFSPGDRVVSIEAGLPATVVSAYDEYSLVLDSEYFDPEGHCDVHFEPLPPEREDEVYKELERRKQYAKNLQAEIKGRDRLARENRLAAKSAGEPAPLITSDEVVRVVKQAIRDYGQVNYEENEGSVIEVLYEATEEPFGQMPIYQIGELILEMVEHPNMETAATALICNLQERDDFDLLFFDPKLRELH